MEMPSKLVWNLIFCQLYFDFENYFERTTCSLVQIIYEFSHSRLDEYCLIIPKIVTGLLGNICQV